MNIVAARHTLEQENIVFEENETEKDFSEIVRVWVFD